MSTDQLDAVSAAASHTIGQQFVAALAAKDRPTLVGLLGDEVDFQAMTPRRSWQEQSGAAVIDEVILGRWFASDDIIDRVEFAEVGAVGDRNSLGYRFVVTNAEGRWLVEQRAYLDVSDGRITWLRILCSGYQPIESR